MDCRHIDFSPTKSQERIEKALVVFPQALLMRLLAFALHLLGVERKAVAGLVGMPDESVKTVVRLAMDDGFQALRDRRRSDGPSVAKLSTEPSPLRISARRQDEWCLVEFGPGGQALKMPLAFRVQARTVLLSLVNAGLLSAQESADALGIHAAHCRELAKSLLERDVAESLIDKRQGQKHEYVVNSEVKAELIQQLAARTITGQSTSSEVLAEQVRERTRTDVSARTVRWHIRKLGLTNIKQGLPELVATLKKNS
jgi:DNA-binding transcriptional ArsR family regulator